MTQGRSLLFLTNFSEACFQAIPVLADWIDREEGTLTVLHVHPSGQMQEATARKAMRSFFAEADRYARCERVLLSGDLSSVAVDYCKRNRPDIVFAPANHKVSPLRMPLHRSIRAELLQKAGVRVWTRGKVSGQSAATRPVENVAYVITGHDDWLLEAQMAARTALRYNARLHLIHLTPAQEIHDGTLGSDIRVGHPAIGTDALRRLVENLPMPPLVHSSTGDEFRELPRLLAESCANVVFVGERHAVRRGIFTRTFNPDLEKFDCEVVCFPDQPLTVENQDERLRDSGRVLVLPGYSR
jgi:hypothetical protein